MADRFYQGYVNSPSNLQFPKQSKVNLKKSSLISEGKTNQRSSNFGLQSRLSPLQKHQEARKSEGSQNYLNLHVEHFDPKKYANGSDAKYEFLRRTVNNNQKNNAQQNEGTVRNLDSSKSSKYISYESKKSVLCPETSIANKYTLEKLNNQFTGNESKIKRHIDQKYRKIIGAKDQQTKYAKMAVTPRQITSFRYQSVFPASNLSHSQSYQQKQHPNYWHKYDKYGVPQSNTNSGKMTKNYDFERKYDKSSVNFMKKSNYEIQSSTRLQVQNYSRSSLRGSISVKDWSQSSYNANKPDSLATTYYQGQNQLNIPEIKSQYTINTSAKLKNSPKMTKNEDYSELNLEMISIALEKVSMRSSIQSQIKRTSLDDFKFLKKLGEGRFGSVSLVVHKKTNLLFALKKVKKSQIKDHDLQNQFSVQIGLQIEFKHKNILSLYGFFDDEQFVYLILEYMQGGSLYDQLKKQKKLSQQMTSRRMRQILLAVDYLHQSKIAHRDLKPQNIVISNGTCKLCDFGSCALFDEQRRRTLIGSPDYVPTQVLNGQEYGMEIDQWCLGVLCYQLLVGKTPFYHVKIKETMQKIRNADIDKIVFPSQMSNLAKDFIRKLIVKNPDQRISIETALNHGFIKIYEQPYIV